MSRMKIQILHYRKKSANQAMKVSILCKMLLSQKVMIGPSVRRKGNVKWTKRGAVIVVVTNNAIGLFSCFVVPKDTLPHVPEALVLNSFSNCSTVYGVSVLRPIHTKLCRYRSEHLLGLAPCPFWDIQLIVTEPLQFTNFEILYLETDACVISDTNVIPNFSPPVHFSEI